jgi:hypothetical protein
MLTWTTDLMFRNYYMDTKEETNENKLPSIYKDHTEIIKGFKSRKLFLHRIPDEVFDNQDITDQEKEGEE